MTPCLKKFPRENISILEPIQEGGQARIFSGILLEQGNSHPVALKIYHESTAIPHEAFILSQLKAPCFPKLYGYFLEDQSHGLIVELLDGISLSTFLQRDKPLNAIAARILACELFAILNQLHQRKNPIIHADISPSNIFLNNTGMISLLDFGAAFEMEMQRPFVGIFGKQNYLAPELSYSNSRPSCSSDLYAVAAVVYATVVLEPFAIKHMIRGFKKLERALADDHELCLILKGCLAPSPRLRPKNPKQLFRYLDSNLDPDIKTQTFRHLIHH